MTKRTKQERSGQEQDTSNDHLAAAIAASRRYFARRLVEIRQAAKLTQVQLSQRAAISQSHISALEKGFLEPRLTTIVSLALALNVEAAGLVSVQMGGDEAQSVDHRAEQRLDPQTPTPERQPSAAEDPRTEKDRQQDRRDKLRLIEQNISLLSQQAMPRDAKKSLAIALLGEIRDIEQRLIHERIRARLRRELVASLRSLDVDKLVTYATADLIDIDDNDIDTKSQR